MQNLLKAFVILSFLLVVSCSKEPLIIPESNIEGTISSRSSITIEMEVVSSNYQAGQLTVDLEADGDFSNAEVESTQTIDLQNNSSISLTVDSYSGGNGSLQFVFTVGQAPPSGLVSVQEIIVDDLMMN